MMIRMLVAWVAVAVAVAVVMAHPATLAVCNRYVEEGTDVAAVMNEADAQNCDVMTLQGMQSSHSVYPMIEATTDTGHNPKALYTATRQGGLSPQHGWNSRSFDYSPECRTGHRSSYGHSGVLFHDVLSDIKVAVVTARLKDAFCLNRSFRSCLKRQLELLKMKMAEYARDLGIDVLILSGSIGHKSPANSRGTCVPDNFYLDFEGDILLMGPLPWTDLTFAMARSALETGGDALYCWYKEDLVTVTVSEMVIGEGIHGATFNLEKIPQQQGK